VARKRGPFFPSPKGLRRSSTLTWLFSFVSSGSMDLDDAIERLVAGASQEQARASDDVLVLRNWWLQVRVRDIVASLLC
jgi:hypothetical protein